MSVIMDVLDSAGCELKLRAGTDELNICCPFCQTLGESSDTRFRLGINTGTGAAHCFNCHWKCRGVLGTAQELAKVYGIPFSPVSAARTATYKRAKKKKLVEGALPAPCGLPPEFERLIGNLDSVGRKAKRYLMKRGVTVAQIVRHNIGFAAAGDMAWRVLFPVTDAEGVVRGCVGRSFVSDVRPKYLGTTGAKMLWNARTDARTAIVSEGIMDALRVELALLALPGCVSVARLGSAITSVQLDQLKEYERVVILPDWDVAGVKGAMELGERCTARGIQVAVAVPGKMDGSDPGSMEESKILDCIRGATVWGATAKLRLRLSATKEVA